MIEFEIPGDPVGYYAVGSRPNRKRMDKYHAYCEKVRIYAAQAGVKLPLVATREAPLRFDTVAFFRNGTHPDPENVHKGIKDALFYQRKGAGRAKKGNSDKYTGGIYAQPLYDAEKPRVKVRIERDCRAEGE